jgi:Flp pilus assembly protein TadG
MKRFNFLQLLKRRGESGQSIIVLAIAFVALLGFVGIVTDVSLLFVRYSGLKRAVDAAAISAAGQMRTDRNFATVNIAARTFIEFYGISPTAVEVQTCLTAPGDPELCTADQRKLVRVRAQIMSPTVFMRLLGYRDILLEASATSETAVMDVVLVIDVSESMGDSTSLGMPSPYSPANPTGVADYDYADIGMGYVYRPPNISHGLNNDWSRISARWARLVTNLNQGDTNASNPAASNIATITNTLVNPAAPVGNPENGLTYLGGQTITGAQNRSVIAGSTLEPRADCRVRFYPNYSRRVEIPGQSTWDGLLGYYRDVMGASWAVNYNGVAYWDGYVPTYNFYGCCNDPTTGGSVDLSGNITTGTNSNPDWNFSDLICQPFKLARDAVRNFLQRVDFTRGDRVAIVTFNRSAFIIDPDGSQPGATHMMDTFPMALNTLNQMVGLNAEPNFYDWNEASGGWIGFSAGAYDHDNDVDTPDQSYPLNYNGVYNATSNPQVYNNFPVYGNCWIMNAGQSYPYSRYTTAANPAAILSNQNNRLPGAGFAYPSTTDFSRTYTHRGGCRDANIGAALREANNALTFQATRHISGAVWVIILVSDGAAGASDPVLRDNSYLVAPNPYGAAPLQGAYGSFGVCPYADSVDSSLLPFCSDNSPETRQFCGFDGTHIMPNGRTEPIDINDSECYNVQSGGNPLYDVDDYARDWADWVGLLDSGASAYQPLRPTIFTIGFGITFTSGGGSCEENVDDCLGEELLRYIADVGDNFQLDIDYQQDYRYGAVNHSRDFDPGSDGWGSRGICEGPGTAGQVVRRAPMESCGNYYNAPGQNELQTVFDDIASKMFTRIAN